MRNNIFVFLSIFLLAGCNNVTQLKDIIEVDIINQAISKNDVSICNNFEDKDRALNCYSQVGSLGSNDDNCKDLSKIDGKILSQLSKTIESNIDLCYTLRAKENGDEGSCLKISKGNGDEISKCYLQVAIVNKSELFCDKVFNKNTKDSCFERVGIEEKNPKICDKIVGILSRNKCISGSNLRLAVSNFKVEYCNDIQDDLWKTKCIHDYYFEVAVSSNNVAICDVDDEKIRNDCHSNFNLSKAKESENENLCNNGNFTQTESCLESEFQT